MIARIGIISLLTVVPLVSGCGDDGPDPAVSDCEHFADIWCEKASSCFVSTGRLPQSDYQANRDVCIRVAIATVPCEDAVAVSPSYDRCLDDIEAMSCSTFDVPLEELYNVEPPSSCHGVIYVR